MYGGIIIITLALQLPVFFLELNIGYHLMIIFDLGNLIQFWYAMVIIGWLL